MPSISGSFTAASIISGGGITRVLDPGTINYILANDTNKVTCGPFLAIGGSGNTEGIKVTGIASTVPGDATISGIQIFITRTKGSTTTSIVDAYVNIIKGGAAGATDKKSVSEFESSDTIKTYGGTSDLWGETWTPGDINSGFGVQFAAFVSDPGEQGGQPFWQYASYTVTYTVPAAPTPPSVDQHFYDGATYHRNHEGKSPEEPTRFVFPVIIPTAKSDRNQTNDPILEYTEVGDPIND